MTEIWTGTADVENGLTLVTVNTGDPLSDANCSKGSLVLIDGAAYFVAERVSTLSFELTRAYAGSTDTEVAMEISPVSEATTNLVSLAAVVARVQSQLKIFDKNSQGLCFNCLGVTGAADPGPGNMAFDNADPTAITRVYFDYLDANDAHRSVAGLLATIRQNTRLRVRSLASTAYVELQVSAAFADQSGYFAGEVSHIDHDGVIGATEPVSVSWSSDGQSLDVDASGTFAGRDAYDDEDGGFRYLSNDGDGDELTGGVLFVKESADTADWGPGIPLRGPKGDRGWAPRFSIASDGLRRVLQLVGYVGGEGAEPTVGVGQYVSAGGLDPDIADGVDIRGSVGASAYDVAVAQGFEGDEDEWLASLNGADGDDGDNGADGTDPGILLNWDDGTSDADPGAGNIRANSVDLSSATVLFVSKTNRAGNSIENYLLGLAASTNAVKGGIVLTQTSDQDQAAINLTGVTNASGYVKLAIATHSGGTSFTDAGAISFQFNRAGDQGSSNLSSIAGAIAGAAEKAAPVSADSMVITDSEASGAGKKAQLGNLRPAVGTLAHGELVFDDSATITADMVGKVLVANRATAITFSFEPSGALGSGWAVIVRNIGAGDLTLQPDGVETIEGEESIVIKQGSSAVVTCTGADFRTLLTGGGSTAAGAHDGLLMIETSETKAARIVLASGGFADALASEDGIDTDASTNEVYDAGADSYSPAPAAYGDALPVQTIADASGSAGWTYRVKIRAAALADLSGTLLRVTLRGGSAGSTLNAYVGQAAAVGDAYDFAAAPQQLLASGSGTISLVANTDKVLDPLEHTFDGTKDYIVAIYVVSGSASASFAHRAGDANANFDRWFKNTSDAATVDATGYTAGSAGELSAVRRIEVAEAFSDMMLVTEAAMAAEQLDAVRAGVRVTENEAIAVNTDLTIEASRGTEWQAGTLALVSTIGSEKFYEARDIDLSGDTAGTSMKVRVGVNSKNVAVSGIELLPD